MYLSVGLWRFNHKTCRLPVIRPESLLGYTDDRVTLRPCLMSSVCVLYACGWENWGAEGRAVGDDFSSCRPSLIIMTSALLSTSDTPTFALHFLPAVQYAVLPCHNESNEDTLGFPFSNMHFTVFGADKSVLYPDDSIVIWLFFFCCLFDCLQCCCWKYSDFSFIFQDIVDCAKQRGTVLTADVTCRG